jgi:hypothetical protein
MIERYKSKKDDEENTEGDCKKEFEEENGEDNCKKDLEEGYVGYKHPPAHARFKKGQSGNPRGRPPSSGPPPLATLLANELKSMIAITENGTLKKVAKVSLIVKQAVNKAVKGEDLRPFEFLLKQADKLQQLAKTPTKNYPRGNEDLSKLTLEEKMRRLKEIIANSKPLDEY